MSPPPYSARPCAQHLRQIPNPKWRHAAVEAWAGLSFVMLAGAGVDNSFTSDILAAGWEPSLVGKYVLFKTANMASAVRYDPDASGYTLAQSMAGLTYGLGLRGLASSAIARATESSALRPVELTSNADNTGATFGILDSNGFLGIAKAMRAVTDGRMGDALEIYDHTRHLFLSGSNLIQVGWCNPTPVESCFCQCFMGRCKLKPVDTPGESA